ncbi:hypothetical protein BTJ68_01814 [Hortaea werneckii EXF-2000]|uniref:Uncharacterized protein n=2 Tax=Hortaea werneckii TaxID=91943 RepID=A0A1Z5TQQ4_HORWE|nr:hypothetical protein BTJ68_01814 [Hortaea werneckii EXF-2000]
MTTPTLMRINFLLSRLPRANASRVPSTAVAITAPTAPRCRHPHPSFDPCRCFAQVNDAHDRLNRDIFFTRTPLQSIPNPGNNNDHQPPDERTLQLGKTVQILHDRLPTLLQSPLPSEILSPQITLHLFPSTHPHLPTVAGRIPYIAALWTAPVAWGRVPLVGNVQLTILSERMVRNHNPIPTSDGYRDEHLIVKWKTSGKTRHRDGTGGVYQNPSHARRDPVDRIKEFIVGSSRTPHEAAATKQKLEGQDEDEFTGVFVFEFDEEGRVVRHTIEHTEGSKGEGEGMARVVSVTDWLLGRFNGKGQEEGVPGLAVCESRSGDGGSSNVYMRHGRRGMVWLR